jgi:SAM-dependent methyltransferase
MAADQARDPEIAERDCPACGATAAVSIGYKGGYLVLACRRCACLYVRPEPTSQQLDELYNNYYDIEGCEGYQVPNFLQEQARRTVRRFRPFRRTGSLLDVGCGAGEFLQAAQQQGWDALGLEISGAAVALARSRGLSAHEGDFLSAEVAKNLDVVIMSELIEHLPNPREFLERAFEILRPGGLLYVTTPNGRGLSRWVMGLDWSVISPPEHIQLFNVSALSRLLRRCGFHHVWVESRGVNIYDLRDHLRRKHGVHHNDLTRNGKAYKLNEQLTRSPIRRAFKELLNAPLFMLRCGDSLRAWATKPS